MSIPFEQSSRLASLSGLSHGFLGREGGVSTGIYKGLNVSEVGGDAPTPVTENRRRAAGALGFEPHQLATLKQTHSNRVITLTAPPEPGSRIDADGHVTATPGILLGILTADCTPILFADPEAGVIGAAHAGWKGAIDGIMANTIAAMVALGARPERIIAAIGPTISQRNYEVGPHFMADFLALHPGGQEHFVTPHNGKEHFDLPGFVAAELRKAGIGTVEDLALCTYAEPERYFSHRYATHHGQTTGRQIALIGLR
ncbi:peptidoglycan editing factor PgeF [Devosia sp.]|uniref:peptidoglycan editing factor PgeF n=1 Tax=Devosia sp. TaxID=1871048 RepID=UPI0032667FDC